MFWKICHNQFLHIFSRKNLTRFCDLWQVCGDILLYIDSSHKIIFTFCTIQALIFLNYVVDKLWSISDDVVLQNQARIWLKASAIPCLRAQKCITLKQVTFWLAFVSKTVQKIVECTYYISQILHFYLTLMYWVRDWGSSHSFVLQTSNIKSNKRSTLVILKLQTHFWRPLALLLMYSESIISNYTFPTNHQVFHMNII